MPDDLRAELRAELGDAGLVQLTAIVAVESFLGRFNRGVGIEPQGYAAGASCLVPDPSGSSSSTPPGAGR